MSGTRIIYTPHPDVTPEAELDALASVYAFILRCGEARRVEEKKNAGAPNAGDEAKGSQRDRPKDSIP